MGLFCGQHSDFEERDKKLTEYFWEYMKRIAFIIALIWTCSSVAFGQLNQTDAQGRKHGKWQRKFENSAGIQFQGQYVHGTPIGTFYSYFENGKIQAELIYSQNGTVRHAKIYHANGKLKAKGKYVNEQKDSTWLLYDDRGRLAVEEEWRDGQYHGKNVTYYTDEITNNFGQKAYIQGRMSRFYQFRNGQLHGKFWEYFPNGNVKVEGEYVDGNLEGSVITYRHDGTKLKMINYRHTVKNGWGVVFDEDGRTILKKIFYLNGDLLTDEELDKYLERNNLEDPRKK